MIDIDMIMLLIFGFGLSQYLLLKWISTFHKSSLQWLVLISPGKSMVMIKISCSLYVYDWILILDKWV